MGKCAILTGRRGKGNSVIISKVLECRALFPPDGELRRSKRCSLAVRSQLFKMQMLLSTGFLRLQGHRDGYSCSKVAKHCSVALN